MNDTDIIISTILKHHPKTQAIYLFGSYGISDQLSDSDTDIAVLFAHDAAKQIGDLSMTDLHFDLEDLLKRQVDLVNLRQVSTVFQKEIIMDDRRIYQSDEYSADHFEMLVISYYQKLNEERRDLLVEIEQNGRILDL